MPASTHRLTELPIEILEQILLYLPSQDIIKMEVVRHVVAIPHDSALTSPRMTQISRQFQDIARNSPPLQYRRDLFSVGLIENPCIPCDFAQCRKLCEEHERKWTAAGRAIKAAHKLPEELIPRWAYTLGRNLIAFRSIRGDCLGFLRVPPVASRRPIEWWDVPPLPFDVRAFAAYPPDNILAVAEEKERRVFSLHGKLPATNIA